MAEQVPDQRQVRMSFPPSYCLVGVYRLLSDEKLRVPIWAKCRHGVRRGAIVALVYAVLTYKAQKLFIEHFLAKSPSVTGLNPNSVFGLNIHLTTYATWVFLSKQCTFILRFFLSKNLRIARERAWDQTVASRDKGADFWQPYVEEWAQPPVVKMDENKWKKYLGGWASRWVVMNVLLAPLDLYPVIGMGISAYFKALQTSRYLHVPYFATKKMSPSQVGVFIEERKWDYRAFGWVAALLEGIPLLGLFFTVSNRIGAAMWAFDLEKRQHEFARGERQLIQPIVTSTGTSVHPTRTTDDHFGRQAEGLKRRVAETAQGHGGPESMTESWEKL